MDDLDPEKNRVELLRFAGILLSDAQRSQVSSSEIFECIQNQLKVALADEDREEFLMRLQHHPSFKHIAENIFEVV